MMSRIDESMRHFSDDELRVARRLASEGSLVTALPSREGTRTADAEVDGVLTEFKRINSARAATVKHALNRAKGQARHVVLDGAGIGMSVETALLGVRRFLAAGPHRLESVRVDLDSCSVRVVAMDGRPTATEVTVVKVQAP